MRSSGARVFYTFIQKAHSIGFGQRGAPQRALDQPQPPQERRLRGPFGVLQQASLVRHVRASSARLFLVRIKEGI